MTVDKVRRALKRGHAVAFGGLVMVESFAELHKISGSYKNLRNDCRYARLIKRRPQKPVKVQSESK